MCVCVRVPNVLVHGNACVYVFALYAYYYFVYYGIMSRCDGDNGGDIGQMLNI